jgi:Spy/CpxP family protein refolding chaperone
MNRLLRNALAATALGAFAVALPAAAQSQSDPHQHEQGQPAGKGPQGMGMGGQGMGGMMGEHRMMMEMMQNCRQMMQQGGGRGLPRLPEGNEKLELQMHAEMMRAMGDILGKYAARLPDKK